MASLFKRKRKNGGHVWYITYYQHGKAKMFSSKTSDKRLAHEIKKRFEENLIRAYHGLDPIQHTVPILLSEFIKTYLEDRRRIGKSSTTRETDFYALKKLMKFTGDVALTSITEFVALRFRDYLLSEEKPASVSIKLRSIRAAFYWAMNKPGEKYLQANPFSKKGIIPSTKGRKLPLCLSPDEKRLFFEAIDESKHLLFFKFLLLSGCRRSEAINLQWTDIDFNEKQITFRKTKTKIDRRIPIELELLQVVMALDKGQPKPFNYTSGWVTRLFVRYRDKAGIRQELHLHSLRHTAATDLLRKGFHLKQIAELLGHADTKTTEIYSHVLPEDLREVAGALTCTG